VIQAGKNKIIMLTIYFFKSICMLSYNKICKQVKNYYVYLYIKKTANYKIRNFILVSV